VEFVNLLFTIIMPSESCSTNEVWLLTVDVFLLGRTDLLRGSLTDGLGQSFTSQTVFGRHDAVYEALAGHVGAVKQLVNVHCGLDVVADTG